MVLANIGVTFTGNVLVVVAFDAPSEAVVDRVLVHRHPSQFADDARNLHFRGRLDHPSDDGCGENLIADFIEAELAVDPVEDIPDEACW